MPGKPIAIVGAGLAGSTLGRYLSQRGVPIVIYESAAASRKYNYAITLQPRCYNPLARILGIDIATFERKVSVEHALNINKVSNSQKPLRVHRQRLEDLIRQGLDVRWESKIDQLQKNGPDFDLYCEGKLSLQHSLIIGADGVHSSVRNNILPQDRLNILPYVAVNGKRRIDKARFEQFYAPSFAASSVVKIIVNDALLQIDVFDQNEDTFSISWIYSRKARDTNDKLFKPNRPKAAATEIPDEFYAEIDQLELKQPFKDVFDAKKFRDERLLSWLMRTTETQLAELEKVAREGVLLMGDSAHAEPILGGEGANAAIEDGLQLAEWIVSNGVDKVGDWYRQKYPGWREGVENSKRRIEQMHAEHKSAL